MPHTSDLSVWLPRTASASISVLMVCLGNICRSPTAQGVLQTMVAHAGLSDCIYVDSAGTSSGHIGCPPDARAQAHALERGYDLSAQRARALVAEDFERFDLILAMDGANQAAAQRLRPQAPRARLMRLMAFGSDARIHDVPDPYYGNGSKFEQVLDLVEDACTGLLVQLRAICADRARAGCHPHRPAHAPSSP